MTDENTPLDLIDTAEVKDDPRIFTDYKEMLKAFGEDVERRNYCVIVDGLVDIPGLSQTIREGCAKFHSLGRLNVNLMHIRRGSNRGNTLFSFKVPGMSLVGERYSGVLIFSKRDPKEIIESKWFSETVMNQLRDKD